MVKIEQFIEKLLLHHDCVIIPGLGGFVARYEPSYHDDDSGLLYPPTRSVGFNAQLTMNDGLLVQAYMQAFDTNFPEANRLVERETKAITEQLQQVGLYRFENLGTLEQTAEHALRFMPQNEGGIAAPDLYGLDAFDPTPYPQAAHDDEAEATAIVAETRETIEENNTSELFADDNDTPARRHYIVRLNKAFVHYAAAAVVAIIFYFAFAVPVNSPESMANGQQITMGETLYGLPLRTILHTSAPKAKPDSIKTETATVAKAEPADTVKMLTEDSKEQKAEKVLTDYYTIVLASSLKEKNAEDYVVRLKKMGLKAAKVMKTRTMLRVVYATFDSEAAAYNELNRIWNNHNDFFDAWVLHVHEPSQP